MSENINIVMDQILQQLESMKKEKEDDASKDIENAMKVISERLKGLEEYGPIINTNIANFSNSFSMLVDRVNSFEPVNEMKVEYNHVFFPGFQSWLQTLKKGRLLIFLTIIIFGLGCMVYYINSDRAEKSDSYYKYEAMKYSGGSIQFIDSIYADKKDFIQDKIDSVTDANKKAERLRNELDKTASRFQEIQRELMNTE